jgi:hypothetical protein
MGKYDDVLPKLKPAPLEGEGLKRQEKIDAVKKALKTNEAGEALILLPDQLASIYAGERAKLAELKAAESVIQLKIDALEQLIVDSWDKEEDGWGAYGASPNVIRLRDGSSVLVEPQPEGKVEDKEKFRLWCIANGLEKQLQLWPSTMNAIAKERCLAGEPQPDGVSVYLRTTVKLRKA